MVQVLLDGLRADPRFEVHHVDARVSDDLEDIGSLRPGKVFRLLRACWQAWWIRLRHGPMAFYYVPAPAKRSAIARDWLVMLLCRPLFPKLILHWHAYGLGEWVEEGGGLAGLLTKRALSRADLSIVLSDFQKKSVQIFLPKSIGVLPNGIEDPCPNFRESLLKERLDRWTQEYPEAVRLVFMAHCTAEKGLFLALDALAALHEKWTTHKRGSEVVLDVAGAFATRDEEQRFRDRVNQGDLCRGDGSSLVTYHGFTSGVAKVAILTEADFMIFPTRYSKEVQPVSIIEAMAFGLPLVSCRWRGIPEMLPVDYVGLADQYTPEGIVAAVERLMDGECSALKLRARFEELFTIASHHQRLADLLAR